MPAGAADRIVTAVERDRETQGLADEGAEPD